MRLVSPLHLFQPLREKWPIRVYSVPVLYMYAGMCSIVPVIIVCSDGVFVTCACECTEA